MCHIDVIPLIRRPNEYSFGHLCVPYVGRHVHFNLLIWRYVTKVHLTQLEAMLNPSSKHYSILEGYGHRSPCWAPHFHRQLLLRSEPTSPTRNGIFNIIEHYNLLIIGSCPTLGAILWWIVLHNIVKAVYNHENAFDFYDSSFVLHIILALLFRSFGI